MAIGFIALFICFTLIGPWDFPHEITEFNTTFWVITGMCFKGIGSSVSGAHWAEPKSPFTNSRPGSETKPDPQPKPKAASKPKPKPQCIMNRCAPNYH